VGKVRYSFIHSQSSNGILLTGECRATCRKGRRRLLSWVETKCGFFSGGRRRSLFFFRKTQNGFGCSPKTIPTRRLLYAVALLVSYSSNKSPVTASDIVPRRVTEREGGTRRGVVRREQASGRGERIATRDNRGKSEADSPRRWTLWTDYMSVVITRRPLSLPRLLYILSLPTILSLLYSICPNHTLNMQPSVFF
jgi:hypothetical protein